MSCCQLCGCGASCCVCCLCAACVHWVRWLGLLPCWGCCCMAVSGGVLSGVGSVRGCFPAVVLSVCALAVLLLVAVCRAAVLLRWCCCRAGVFPLVSRRLVGCSGFVCLPAGCWAAVRCAAAVAVGVGAGGASAGASFRRCACQTCGGCGASVLWLLLVCRCCCCAVPLMMSAAVLLAVVLRCCCGCCCRLAVGCRFVFPLSFFAGGKKEKGSRKYF